ncbi:adhesin [Mesobacillus campisalis]|uniref:Adhesin n=1 Tax=Mesobacillus campisalis TaxID=1408103 RepID=A0A0M2SUC2_9BACI|nr:zinc ABC transporter substrate-binding protein [Mesobacillus campisalis]KKK36215.1 adhesin [Mesobacillus campisalis]
MKKKLLILLILVLGTALAGCSEGNEAEENKNKNTNPEMIQVYTTVYPLQYFTEAIGEDYVQVESIYPPGADEHTFEPSQKDMIKMADSDLFIYIGLGLEGFVEKAKNTLKNEQVAMLAAGEHIQFDDTEEAAGDEHSEDEHAQGEDEHAEDEHAHGEDEHAEDEHAHGEDEPAEDEHGHHHGDTDPHVWLDPLYSKQLAEAIKDQLIEMVPSQRNRFEQNFQELAKQLDELHADFDQTIKNARHHEVIVAHSAYGYWEERYGMKQLSISGLSTTNEPSQKELQTLISHGKEEGLKYVLFEQNFESRLAETVQKELGADALYLHNLSVLTNDDIANEETYFTLMQKNLETLDTALNK